MSCHYNSERTVEEIAESHHHSRKKRWKSSHEDLVSRIDEIFRYERKEQEAYERWRSFLGIKEDTIQARGACMVVDATASRLRAGRTRFLDDIHPDDTKGAIEAYLRFVGEAYLGSEVLGAIPVQVVSGAVDSVIDIQSLDGNTHGQRTEVMMEGSEFYVPGTSISWGEVYDTETSSDFSHLTSIASGQIDLSILEVMTEGFCSGYHVGNRSKLCGLMRRSMERVKSAVPLDCGVETHIVHNLDVLSLRGAKSTNTQMHRIDGVDLDGRSVFAIYAKPEGRFNSGFTLAIKGDSFLVPCRSREADGFRLRFAPGLSGHGMFELIEVDHEQ